MALYSEQPAAADQFADAPARRRPLRPLLPYFAVYLAHREVDPDEGAWPDDGDDVCLLLEAAQRAGLERFSLRCDLVALADAGAPWCPPVVRGEPIAHGGPGEGRRQSPRERAAQAEGIRQRRVVRFLRASRAHFGLVLYFGRAANEA